MGMSTYLYQLGRRSFVHHTRVLLAWIVVVLVGAGAALSLGDGTRDEFDIPGSEANDAFDDLGRTFPELSGLSAYVVVVAPDGTSITSERSQALVERTVDDLAAVQGVTDVTSPYDDLARDAGLAPVANVTKTRCDLLVVAEVGTQSGKARRAREYGKPVISADEFFAWLGLD